MEVPKDSNNRSDIMDNVKRLVGNALAHSTDNYTIEVSNTSQQGLNYLGLLRTVKVNEHHKDDKSKYYFIVKMAMQENYYRTIFPIRNIYKREIFIYSEVIPSFLKFCKEMGVEQYFQLFPKTYYTSIEEGMEALVMDDMSVKGFKVGSGVALDYSHALLAIRELGKFHALSYAIRDQKPELLKDWTSKSADCFYSSTVKNIGMRVIMDVGRVVLESYRSNENRAESEVLESFLSRLSQFFALPSIEKVDKYSVINHGDFQMRNMLFKYGDCSQPHHPTALCMIDWQLSRLASPALDILFFLSVCGDKNLRDHHYDNLIQEYHKSLSSFLEQLGSDPNILLPFEVLLQHLKEFAGFGLFNAMWLIPMAAQECDFSKCTNEDALLKEFPTSPQQQYVPIIRDIITDFIKYGYQL